MHTYCRLPFDTGLGHSAFKQTLFANHQVHVSCGTADNIAGQASVQILAISVIRFAVMHTCSNDSSCLQYMWQQTPTLVQSSPTQEFPVREHLPGAVQNQDLA